MPRVLSSLTILSLIGIFAAVSGSAFAQRYDDRERGYDQRDRGRDYDERDRDRNRDQDRDFDTIGTVRVGPEVDLGVVNVSRRDGRFARLSLEARDGDIIIFDLRVIYENGRSDEFAVREILRRGARTRPFDVDRNRAIDRIEIVARTVGGYRDNGIISVAGERAGRPLPPPEPGSVLLGTDRVGFRIERTVIDVGRGKGRFEGLRFAARDDDILLLNVRVTYGNGQTSDLRVGEIIRRGERSRVVPLERDRFIDRIEVVSRARIGFRGRATLEVYGVAAGRGGGEARWEELGCQRVGFTRDRDVIHVGRREGKFSALRLSVSGNRIFIFNLRVIYGNGSPDDLPVRFEIRPGEETRPIDLKGDRRAIRDIELTYRAEPSLRGDARVCVSGRQ